MTALCEVTVCAEADDGVGRPTVPPVRRPVPLSFPKYPQHPNFVIPRAVAESISPSQRISRRIQRPLHSTMDTATSRSMTALCGVTVCAEADDGVGRPTVPPSAAPSPCHSRSTRSTPTSSFRAQSRNPSPPSQRISRRIQRPLHSTMDTATSRSMTALCGVTVCAEADDGVGRPTVPPSAAPSPCHSRSTRSTPTSSFRAQSRNPSPPSQRISRRIQRPLHSTMDTATSRSMTALYGVTVCAEADDGVGRSTVPPSAAPPPVIPGVPAAPQLRHSARSRGIHLPPANASAGESSALCTPPWILRLRAV